MTRLMKGKGFLYTGGSFVDTITVRPKPEDDDYALHLNGSSAILTLSEEQAVQVAVDLITALYDGDRLPMEAAERLQYLASAVIADLQSRPTCDICGVREEDSALEWDGETGLHVECQRTHLPCLTCGGAGATNANGPDPDTCSTCRGSGWVPVYVKAEVTGGYVKYRSERDRLGL